MSRLLRAFDASGSNLRPEHRGGGGPIRNDVLRQIEEPAERFGFRFTRDPKKADVLITNDAIPIELSGKIPAIKRMDGSFRIERLLARNAPHALAAAAADGVVFISSHAAKIHAALGGKTPGKRSVVLNAADHRIFHPGGRGTPSKFPGRWCASATDWNRPEKRLADIVRLVAAAEKFGISIELIGRPPEPGTPLAKLVGAVSAITFLGYVETQAEMAAIMRRNDLMIHPAWSDSCPKTVAQAVAIGLPTIHSSTGGTPEMIPVGAGIAIEEEDRRLIVENVPEIPADAAQSAVERLFHSWTAISERADAFARRQAISGQAFETMLSGYFSALKVAAEASGNADAEGPPRQRTLAL